VIVRSMSGKDQVKVKSSSGQVRSGQGKVRSRQGPVMSGQNQVSINIMSRIPGMRIIHELP